MSFILRQISLTADGREIVRSATLAKPQLTLGRASTNDIHLPDLALEPDHARIEQLDARTIRVRATGTLGFTQEGRTTLSADIDPAKGAELRFGGHRLTIGQEDGATILTIRRVDAVSEASEEKEEARVFSLRGLTPPKRLTAWGLALAILIGFLAVPIYSYAARDTRTIYSVKGESFRGDGAWSSGPLSQAHHALEGKCETCHQKAFVSVRDSACQTCHKSVHDHAPPPRIAMARAEPGVGGKFLNLVASSFGKPPEGACVDCHREHEGAGPMQPTPQAFCTDCHGSLKDRLKDTKLGNAADFGTAHPQFTALVQYNPGQRPSFTRASLDANPRDDSGLKFPHDIHLSKVGGVARMARTLGGDYGDALACKDCHRPTADGVRFLPVDMERDCQSCHSLAFETVGGTVRTLRHGQPAQVIADLRAYYRSTGPAQPLSLGGMARRRPGDYAQGRAYHAYFGAAAVRPSRAEDAIRAVFSKGGACYDCHTVTGGGANWQVTPVRQTMRYMMNGWFDHKAHRTETCESCHAAPKSHDARQLLLPKLDSCRTCHGGEKSRADVPSGCAMCHSYHADEGAPWTPSALALKKDRAGKDED